MNTNKIRELSKIVRDTKDHLIFVEPEITNLLLAISDFILKDSMDSQLEEVPKEYITLKEYYDRYYFISMTSLHEYCKSSDEFRENCTKFIKNKWYILPDEATAFFYDIPIYKRRIDNIFKIGNKDVSCNKENLIKEGKNNL